MSPTAFSLLAFNVLFDAGPEAIEASIAAIEKNDADIVCLTELTPKFAARFKERLWKQAQFLVARYEKETRPVLLAGDLNESPGGDALAVFARGGYTRSCERAREADCGATWPGSGSLFPATWEIDHIFGIRVRFERARVVREGGSDHDPVWAELYRASQSATQLGRAKAQRRAVSVDE